MLLTFIKKVELDLSYIRAAKMRNTVHAVSAQTLTEVDQLEVLDINGWIILKVIIMRWAWTALV
jgi:hypothetical protein